LVAEQVTAIRLISQALQLKYGESLWVT